MKGAARRISPIASEIPMKIARGRYSCSRAFIITSLHPKVSAPQSRRAQYPSLPNGESVGNGAAPWCGGLRYAIPPYYRGRPRTRIRSPVPAQWSGTADTTRKIPDSIHGRGTSKRLAQCTIGGKSMLTATRKLCDGVDEAGYLECGVAVNRPACGDSRPFGRTDRHQCAAPGGVKSL